jgi:8-oxo-dGTP diphosphatase
MASFETLYPIVVVDVALFTVIDDSLRVLLVQRAQEPERRRWALPGGMLKPEVDTCLESAARRVMKRKVSVDIPHLEEVCTFSGAERDPRGWSIGVLFCAMLPLDLVTALVRDKVEALEWAPAADPGHRMAFDHDVQLGTALARLRARVEARALPLHLLPERFTLTQLQRSCESILGHELDKSAFRRRLKASTDLVVVDEFVRGAQRPAQLYRAHESFNFLA